MRILETAVAGLALVAVVACSPGDSRYLREGVGTELFSSGLPETTQLQDTYVGFICRQAGIVPGGGEGLCVPVGAAAWTTFVQAGLNDIDQRCDGYLAWLDNKRRWNAPILQQIGDTHTAVEAILAATAVGPHAIAIVGAAFGLARNSFTNLTSRLILEVNHSTVQSIVLHRQTDFRKEIRGKLIPGRPEAIYALRQYLRICMPFTIETEINTTVTTVERAGQIGLEEQLSRPLVDASTVGRQVIREVNAPLERPVKSSEREGSAALGTVERKLTDPQVRGLQVFACRPATGTLDQPTRRVLLAFLSTHDKDTSEPDRLTQRDLATLQGEIADRRKACP